MFDWEGKILVFRVIKGVEALETDDLRSGFFCFFFLIREGKYKERPPSHDRRDGDVGRA